MPELPEVEVVRKGLESWVLNKTIAKVTVYHPRAIRRHLAGAKNFSAALRNLSVESVNRRGKFMWLVLSDHSALVTHLGMSGQVLIQDPKFVKPKHSRIQIEFKKQRKILHFVDQRTFGGMHIEELIQDANFEFIPGSVAHIARDPFDPKFDSEIFVDSLRKRNTQIKRALLNQELISGIGNIYADEALWRAKLHWATQTAQISKVKARELLKHATDVMWEALAQGGTSFDSLYVNVNGESGYFERGLNAYGREDEPCSRCGRLIVRDSFMNRSSFRCPKCQPSPK